MSRRIGIRSRVWAGLVGVVAVLATAIVPTGAAMAAGPATVQMEFSAIGNTTQGSGTPFTSMISLSCAGADDASCDDVEITIPWPADPDPTLGASPLVTWGATAASNVPGLIDANVIRDEANRQWVIKLKRPILADGSSTGIQLTITPPNGSTLNGFQFPIQPTVTGSSFPQVTAPDPIVFTSTASASPTFSKSLTSTPVPGGNITWSLRSAFGTPGTAGTLGVVDGTRKIVDVLPPEVELVSVTSSAGDVPYSYDEATHTVTFSTEDMGYPLTVGTSYNYQIVTRVKSDIPAGTVLRNEASLSYRLVGDTDVTTLTRNASGTVVADINFGNLFSKSGSGNLSGNLSGAQTIADQLVTTVETDKTARYSLFVNRSDNPYSWEIVDPLPCLDGTGSLLSSGAVDSICTQPAFHVTKLQQGADPETSTNGALTGRTVTLVYTDGSSEEIQMRRGVEVFPKPGGTVATVKMSGEYTTTGTGNTSLWIDGTIDASLQDRTEVLSLSNKAYARGALSGLSLPANYSTVTKTMTIARNFIAAGVVATPTYTYPANGNSVNFNIRASLQTTNSSQAAAGKTVVVFPEGAFSNNSPSSDVTRVSNWMGTGRSANVYAGGMNNYGFQVTKGDVAPGAYPYDVYTGFAGTLLDSCSDSVNGSPIATNDLIIDTTGIIGEPGVPTAVCHQTGYFIVTGPVPDSQTTKQVRGDLDTVWTGPPGTTQVKGDGTGTADYKITWVNNGSGPLRDTTLYDVLPTPGDSYTVGNQGQRGSTFRPTLAGPVVAPSGWTVSYSTATNPCRPEVLATNPGCDNTWVTAPPAPISSVTALRFVKATPSAVGYLAEFTYTMDAGAFNSAEDVAWNTVSTRTYVPGTTPAPLAPTETPRVGIGMVAVPGIELVKEVCDADSCDPDAAIGAGGWASSTSVPYFGGAKWRVTVTNTGQAPLSDVEISDPLVSDCAVTIGNLAVGASASQFCESTELTASMTNEATVTATGSAITVSDSDTASVTVAAKPVSDIGLVYESCDPEADPCDPNAKVGESGWSHSTTVPFGGDGKWRVTVVNTGDTTLEDVTVVNSQYPECAFVPGTLASGESASLTCDVSLVDGTLESTATVTATPPYGDAALSDTDTAEIISVDPLVEINVEKEVCSTGNDCDPSADSLTGGWVKAAELEAGTTPYWRFVVTNNGQVPLVDVSVTDPSLPNCTIVFPKLAPGEVQTLSCTGEPAFTGVGGTVTATGTDPRGGGVTTVTSQSEASVTVRDPGVVTPGPGESGPGTGEEATAPGGDAPGGSDSAEGGLASTGSNTPFVALVSVLLAAGVIVLLLARRRAA